jgi:hypothetical protein
VKRCYKQEASQQIHIVALEFLEANVEQSAKLLEMLELRDGSHVCIVVIQQHHSRITKIHVAIIKVRSIIARLRQCRR